MRENTELDMLNCVLSVSEGSRGRAGVPARERIGVAGFTATGRREMPELRERSGNPSAAGTGLSFNAGALLVVAADEGPAGSGFGGEMVGDEHRA